MRDEHISKDIVHDVFEALLMSRCKKSCFHAVNVAEVMTKFEIGRILIEVIQDGEVRATYGKELLKGVSEVLLKRFGSGWSSDTLERCRTFYQVYSKSATPLRKFVEEDKREEENLGFKD